MFAVASDTLGQNLLEMTETEDRESLGALSPDGPTDRSAIASARADRTGVLIDLICSAHVALELPVELTGLEPVTYWLQTSRSNQLSYSPAGSSLRALGAELASEPLFSAPPWQHAASRGPTSSSR